MSPRTLVSVRTLTRIPSRVDERARTYVGAYLRARVYAIEGANSTRAERGIAAPIHRAPTPWSVGQFPAEWRHECSGARDV